MERPFKIGDRIRIESRPRYWSNGAGGDYGLEKVKYPYDCTVENIKIDNDGSGDISIFDGKYGWWYTPELFKKIGSSSKFTEAKEEKITILKRKI